MKDIPRKRNSIEFKVWAPYALFSDPVTRVGGEKFSYQIPTYEALKGIVESVYWKPTIVWIVDAVRVMKRIQTESKGVKTLVMDGSKPADLSFYTYLRDVEYQVVAHFEFNPHYPDLKADWNENKHHNIARRAVVKGGRRDIFLGSRECQGYVEPCTFGEEPGFYDEYGEIDFGFMFHGYDYPNETGKPELWKRLWRAKMKDGIVEFPEPASCPDNLREFVRPMEATPFVDKKNFSSIETDASVIQLNKEEVR